MEFLQQMINGIMLGAIYALFAIGYTLIFGVLNVLHFAHGSVFMLGAYIGLYLVLLFHLDIFTTVLITMALTAVLGVVIDLIAVRPVAQREYLAPLVCTIGVSIILENVVVQTIGATQKKFPEIIQVAYYHLGSLTFTSTQLFILFSSVTLMILLFLLVNKTRLGRAMRAVAENHNFAMLMGIDVNRVVLYTFAIASSLAGAAGILVNLTYSVINPFIGFDFAVKGLVVMLLGGLGNITGALLGGLIVGMVEILSSAFISPTYKEIVVFLLMIAILIFKPTGIMGDE